MRNCSLYVIESFYRRPKGGKEQLSVIFANRSRQSRIRKNSEDENT